MAYDRLALLVAERAGYIFPVALKGRDNVELSFGPTTGADSAPVDHKGRPVQAGHGHNTAWHILVAAGN